VHPIPLQAELAERTLPQSVSFESLGMVTAMSLINLVLILIVIGVLLWLVNNYIPMDGKIKQIINVVVVIAVVVWLIQIFIGPLPDLRVGS
jgi:hypothetical protein